MEQQKIYMNAREINHRYGIKPSLLKYHRLSGNIKGYRLEGGKEWLYKLHELNMLRHEHMHEETWSIDSEAVKNLQV